MVSGGRHLACSRPKARLQQRALPVSSLLAAAMSCGLQTLLKWLAINRRSPPDTKARGRLSGQHGLPDWLPQRRKGDKKKAATDNVLTE